MATVLLRMNAPAQQTPAVQQSFTWEQLREKLLTTNPTLLAARIGIEESHAQETTAFLRPNPDFTASVDQFDPFTPNPYRPLSEIEPYISFDYLHERAHKRELRLESAQKGTAVAQSQLADQERGLVFNLRTSYVQTLQAKAVLALAKENLDYYDRFLQVSQERKQAGDIAQVDLDRLELQRVQYESDLQNALVSLRTAKIQLLQLLNERIPVESFDVTGPYDFKEEIQPLGELRRVALESRPDLKAAVESVDKARTDYHLAVANGSTDPTFGLDIARNPPISAYVGLNVTIPLRIFDRNQGEKLRTQNELDASRLTEQAARMQVLSDVRQAWLAYQSAMRRSQLYSRNYLGMAQSVREHMEFSYRNAGATLLDYLDAVRSYRDVELAAHAADAQALTAIHQLSFAIGTEVTP